MKFLPVLSANEIRKTLEKAGFAFEKRSKGSHLKLKKTNHETLIVTIPSHREVSRGVILNILRQANLTKEQFLELLKK